MAEKTFNYNVSDGDLRFGTTNLVMGEATSSPIPRMLQQMGLISQTAPGKTIERFFIGETDLPTLSPFPPAHRYFYPTTDASGREAMMRVPKIIVIRDQDSIIGDPMLVLYYFWTRRSALNALSMPFTVEKIISAASDIIERVIPMEKTPFIPPVWAELGSDVNSRRIKARESALMRTL